jgi:hypothetical protein
MEDVATRVSSASRKKLFGSRPIFKAHEPEAGIDLALLEEKLGFRFPTDLKVWLETLGFGDLDDELAIRAEWLNVLDRGELKGHVVFGQDGLGNFYSFGPDTGDIHFICRSAPEYAPVARSFREFIIELEQRDFRIYEWIDALSVESYDWGV